MRSWSRTILRRAPLHSVVWAPELMIALILLSAEVGVDDGQLAVAASRRHDHDVTWLGLVPRL